MKESKLRDEKIYRISELKALICVTISGNLEELS